MAYLASPQGIVGRDTTRWEGALEQLPAIRTALLRFADEVRSQIRIACALVHGHLRIGTERAAHVYSIIAHTIRRNLIWSLALFAPGFHSSYDGKLVRPRSASAVIHSWNHEQPKPVVLMRSHFFENTGVVVHAVQR